MSPPTPERAEARSARRRDLATLGGIFYSPLYRAAASAPMAVGTPDQWRGFFQNRPGVRLEEMDFTGLDGFLSSAGPRITRDALCDHLSLHQVSLREVVRTTQEPGFEEWQESRTRRLVGSEAAWQDIGRAAEVEGYPSIADAVDDRDPVALLEAYDRLEELGEGDALFEDHALAGGRRYREFTLQVAPQLTDAQVEWNRRDDGRWLAQLGTLTGAGDSRAEAKAALEQLTLRSPTPYHHYIGPHFPDPNIVVHVRCTVREGRAGEAILYVEEVQSDLHQEGRKKGYDAGAVLPIGFDISEGSAMGVRVRDSLGRVVGVVRAGDSEERLEALNATLRDPSRNTRFIHSARLPTPFSKTWPLLAMKRVLALAAAEGYASVAWTTGEMIRQRTTDQAPVDRVEFELLADGLVEMATHGADGEAPTVARVKMDHLEEHCGAQVAQRVRSELGRGSRRFAYLGEIFDDAHAFERFYDGELTNEVRHYVRRLGSEVRSTDISAPVNPTTPAWRTVPAVAITPQMRAALQQGQPLFRLGAGHEFSAAELLRARDNAIMEQLRLRLGARLARPVTRDDLFLVRPSPAQQEVAEQLGAVLGRAIRFVDASPGLPHFHGLADPEQLGTIFVHGRSRFAIPAVVGHELCHHLERDAAEDYKLFEEMVQRLAKRPISHLPPEERREILADILGEQFMSNAFWSTLRDEQPGLFSRVLNFVRDTLDRFVRRLSGQMLEGSDYVRQTEDLQQLCAKMVMAARPRPLPPEPSPDLA